MAAYTRAVLEPLVDALERSYARTCELERENGVLTERLAGLERVRDAALAYIEELEVTSAQKSDVQTKALPAPVSPRSGTMLRRREPRWRRWVRQVVLGR